MMGINWTSAIAGIVTVGGAVSMFAGYPALGAVFSNPATAQELTALVTALTGLYSTFAPALKNSTTLAAANKITGA
jgi:hypothetical protein